MQQEVEPLVTELTELPCCLHLQTFRLYLREPPKTGLLARLQQAQEPGLIKVGTLACS
jgi:hypothetical protein